MEAFPSRLRRGSLERAHLPRFGMSPGRGGRLPRQRHFLRNLRAGRRLAQILLLTAVSIAVQSVLLLLPGRGKVTFARFYWSAVAQVLGLRVRVIGQAVRPRGRAVVFVANHSSWLDIPALGGRVEGCFVSKDAVGSWPLIGLVARLGRSIFITRTRTATARERDEMRAALARGDNLLLFPEGTSSDGSRVLPFRSSFFAIAHGPREPGETLPLVQPVSIVYDRLAGLPVGRSSRTVFSWFGDMSLAPHAWTIAQWRGKRATLLLHPPLDPAAFDSRKALAEACWQAVADGAATLRQNRLPEPRVAPAPAAGATSPAFA
jgi:lyso-ornithine lipid O-acyltransferase